MTACLKVKVFETVVIAVCWSVPTVHPDVPSKVTARAGRVKVPVIVSGEFIVMVVATVIVMFAKLIPLVSSV